MLNADLCHQYNEDNDVDEESGRDGESCDVVVQRQVFIQHEVPEKRMTSDKNQITSNRYVQESNLQFHQTSIWVTSESFEIEEENEYE